MQHKFIQLTPHNDNFKFFVNSARIEVMFQSGSNEGTAVYLTSSPSLRVKETPEQIIDMIQSTIPLVHKEEDAIQLKQ